MSLVRVCFTGSIRGGLFALVFTVFACRLAAQPVLINEIMYHPSSHDPAEEWIELVNFTNRPVHLGGWKVTRGVTFDLPNMTLPAGGYLVLTADLARFKTQHPEVANAIGNWIGTLRNSHEELELTDATGREVDRVDYANEGDWAVRSRGPLHNQHRGWIWKTDADGAGKSIELINPAMDNREGQNWSESINPQGTPGRANSRHSADIAPMLLNVRHTPSVPMSTDSIVITAQLSDESPAGLRCVLHYRVDAGTPSPFVMAPMSDNGLQGDGAANDGVFGQTLSPLPNGTIVEFYLEAADSEGRTRFWPGPAVQEDGTLAQTANLLLQVDDAVDPGNQPLYRIILTETERAELEFIGDNLPDGLSDASMNATFIGTNTTGGSLKYLVGVGNRGHGSRLAQPNNYRVDFRSDDMWKNVTGINLNSVFTYLQVLGAAMSEHSGVVAGRAQHVQLRVNNANPTTLGHGEWHYGSYAANEYLDDAFAARAFNPDGNGNLYRALKTETQAAGFAYLGEDENAYRATYVKRTHASLDDWTDLIELTRALNGPPGNEYLEAVGQVANIDQWMRHLALMTLFSNMESGLNTGVGDDFFFYRGVQDRRFVLVSYDLDSIFGEGGVPSAETPLFGAQGIPVFGRLLEHPAIAPSYFRSLVELMDTTFSAETFKRLSEQLLNDRVPRAVLDRMASWLETRRQFVRSQIPRQLTINVPLTATNDLFLTTGASVALSGFADVLATSRVTLNGIDANWTPRQGRWVAAAFPLNPGVNRIVVRSHDATGVALQESTIDVWRNTGEPVTVAGTVSSDIVWTATGGPYYIPSSGLTILPGATLTIGPGTTVYLGEAAVLQVQGRIVAEGLPEQRIRFTRLPWTTNLWGQVQLLATREDNRLLNVDFEYPGPVPGRALQCDDSTALIEGCTWSHTRWNLISTFNSSLIVRSNVFPGIDLSELIIGQGIPIDGHMIIEGNTFGSAEGYSDIIDFSGGKRPGPILQILNNVFTGGSDDALDLDATDAHVEGNVFMHITQSNEFSSANAIATDLESDLTIVRNLFIGNDHAILLKNGARATIANNTFIGNRLGAVSFGEPERGVAPGREAVLDGNIFHENGGTIVNVDPRFNAPTIVMRRSMLPDAANWPFAGNLAGDPMFMNPTNDFRLQRGSPAAGTGPAGLDMGAHVPGGAVVNGIPQRISASPSLTLEIGGPGITHYRAMIDGAAWSGALSVDQPIVLNDLANGVHTVKVIGRNSAGSWQSESATLAAEWRVDSGLSRVLINELQANNRSSVAVPGQLPDWVELSVEGRSPVDLSGMSLSDDPSKPRAFVFPPGTMLAPGDYMIIQLGGAATPFRLHADFALSQEGDSLHLFAAGPVPVEVDSVEFGQQIPDFSIGRDAAGQWRLMRPTIGAANLEARVGPADGLRINEWLARAPASVGPDYVEIYNTLDMPVELSGVSLTDSPAGSPFKHRIAPLSYASAFGYAVFHADDEPGLGPSHLSFSLDADQGSIGIFSREGAVIDQVIYGPQRSGMPEGRSPNGSDEFLVFGQLTPGSGNPSPGGSASNPVRLNELMADNPSHAMDGADGLDWVELHNSSSETADLSGLGLSDDPEAPGKWRFPDGTQLGPRGYVLIYCDSLLPPSTTNTGFGLGRFGDAVFLSDRTTNGSGLLDSVRFGIQATGWSLGRSPDGVGAWVLTAPSPGVANTAAPLGQPGDLRINEWMARPETGEDWFELYNVSDRPVVLDGLSISDDPAEPARYRFPALSFIGVGTNGFLRLLATGDAAGGPDEVGFKLAGEGETIALFGSDGAVLLETVFGTQQTGISEGLFPDGSDQRRTYPTSPSPGMPNELDTDADTLPDEWERAYQLNPASAFDAFLDSDGDGFSNAEEHIAGTNPRDAASRLTIVAFRGVDGRGWVMFHAAAHRVYSLEARAVVGTGDWFEFDRIGPVSAPRTVQRPLVGLSEKGGFFRIGAHRTP